MMATFEVTTVRTERIVFLVEAESAEEAENRYLGLGDEFSSETISLEVEAIVDVDQVLAYEEEP